MAFKKWDIELDGTEHTVTLDYKLLTSRRTIHLDGKLVHDDKVLVDIGTVHDFVIKPHQLTLVIYPNLWFTYSFDLIVDGVSISTGQPAKPIRGIPSWTWGFVFMCGVVFLLAGRERLTAAAQTGGVAGASITGAWIGGLVGAAVGYCIAVAKNFHLTLAERMAICAAVVLVFWVILSILP